MSEDAGAAASGAEASATAEAAAAAANAAGGADKAAGASDAPDWRAALPEDMRGDASIAKYKSLDEFAKGFKSLSNLVGREKIPLPKAGDAEDEARFYNALGRPEKPDGYEIAKPEKLPEGFTYSDELAGGFKTAAHAAGLTAKQAAALHDWYVGNMTGAFAQQADQAQQARVAAETELRTEWGAGFDRNMTAAREAARMFGGNDFMAYLDESGLGNDPRMARMLVGIAKKVGGIETLPGERRTSAELTPAELDDKINAVRSEIMALDRFDPRAEAAQTRLRDLLRLKSGVH